MAGMVATVGAMAGGAEEVMVEEVMVAMVEEVAMVAAEQRLLAL